MTRLGERAWFLLSRALGGMLRAGKYATVQVIALDDALQVRKRRLFYAPLLVWLGDGLMWTLGTGLRVLPQREWEERERRLYGSLYGQPIQVHASGTLILPCLPGETLATLLERRDLEESARNRAINLAVAALAALHGRGITHGDAMAENVLVDLGGGVGQWFDFETVHDSRRSMAWRRADDMRALLATVLVRTNDDAHFTTLQFILHAYQDEDMARLLAAVFGSVWQRPLAFHLGQARLSLQSFQRIGQILNARADR